MHLPRKVFLQKEKATKTAAKKKAVVRGRPELVVGIGASAGGVSALKAFFAELREVQRLAVVVVQHIDLLGGHLACEVLRKNTAAPVQEIESGQKLEAGNIYIAPPHSLISLHSGRFKIQMAEDRLQRQSQIDYFFKSLAENFSEEAVGVVFSGEGSDGSFGLKAINDAGGMTIAQNPESSEHSSMPQSAIAHGIVDCILTPSEIPAQLVAHANYLQRLHEVNKTVDLPHQIGSALIEICEILHRQTSHDFKHYKTSTLIRRIQRRMQVLQLESVATYIERLQSDNGEGDSLFKELLINVTSFFRDPEAFEELRDNVIRKLFHKREANQKLRVWVSGCSTGEEAYSMAILLKEEIARTNATFEVQVIATDIDEAALNVARRGSYPLNIAETVSPERLQRYFVRKGGRYQVIKELRECCLFSSHNLINDPPFSQLDLISCRNVLIYLGSHLQKKLIPVFHYALKPNGYLFLGTSESLSSHKELFKPVSIKHRIAQRKTTAIPSIASFHGTINSVYAAHFKEAPHSHEADIHLVSQRIVLDEFSAKYAVVNEEFQVLSVSAGIQTYLAPSEGGFHNNITKLADPQLRVALRNILSEAKKVKRRVDHDSSILKRDKEFRRIGLTVQPMPQLGEDSGLFMVVFRDLGVIFEGTKEASPTTENSINLSLVEQLETELTSVREELDKTVQELEASNEELKSSNEELLSMNEELQSANEELETSKEEVQSSNDALQRSNSDLENLLASTEIATLFLDDNFHIRNFTPAVTEIYPLVKADLNRPLSHFTHNAVLMPAFPQINDFKKSARIVEDEVVMADGRLMLRRISPYRTHDQHLDGIVVTFVDVTEMRKAEERFRLANQASQVGIWDWNLMSNEINWVTHQKVTFGELPIETNQTSFDEFKSYIFAEDRPRILKSLENAIQNKKDFHHEFRIQWPDGQIRWIESRGMVLCTQMGDAYRVVGTHLDLTERKAAEDAIRSNENRFRQLAEGLPHLVWITDSNGLLIYLNQRWFDYTGQNHDTDLQNFNWPEMVHPEDRERSRDAWQAAIRGEASYKVEYRLRSRVGEYRWFLARATPIYDNDGKILQWFGTNTDIHELRCVSEALRESEERYRLLTELSPQVIWAADHRGQINYANTPWFAMTGLSANNLSNEAWLNSIHPEDREQAVRAWDLAIQNKTEYRNEYRIGNIKSKKYCWVLAIAKPLFDEAGNVLRWAGVAIDLQNRKEIELEQEILSKAGIILTSSLDYKENLKKLTEVLVEYLADWGWVHIYEPVSGLKYYGVHSKDAALLPALNDFVASVKHSDESAVASAMKNKKVVKRNGLTDEYYKKVAANQTELAAFRNLKPGAVLATPLIARGLPYGAIALVRGESEGEFTNKQKDIMQALAEKVSVAIDNSLLFEEAQKANVTKTTFLANVSHEIRSPLGAIMGFSDLLQQAFPGNTTAHNYLERISRNSRQLERLIDELLDLSKIEADRLEIEQIPFSPKDMIGESLATLSLKAEEKGLQFRCIWLSVIPKVLISDPTRLRQILVNLINNAIKFTEKGHVQLEVSLTPNKSHQVLMLRVTDTGVGLTPEQQSVLFKPFTQADSSITRKFGGTGLGLAISKRLCQLLGGDLRIERSEPGRGTTFVATLLTAEAHSRDMIAAEKLAPLQWTKQSLFGKNILVVDDSPDNLIIVTKYLDRLGAKHETAENGELALQKAKTKTFDLILMDIQMPKMDGFTALKAIRSHGCMIPIIALTAHAMKGEKERCLEAGFTDYLSKPIDRPTFFALLWRIFNVSPLEI